MLISLLVSWTGRPGRRKTIRVASCTSTAALLSYIYIDYLMIVDWAKFGLHPMAPGTSRRLADYFLSGHFDEGLAHLKDFTFSAAMLLHGRLYTLTLALAAAVQLPLEHDRIRWLQQLFTRDMRPDDAMHVCKWLDVYLYGLGLGYLAFLTLGYFDIDTPLLHYFFSGLGLLSTTSAMYAHSTVPCMPSVEATPRNNDDCELAKWTIRAKRITRPCLHLIMCLTVICIISAMWKCEKLGDDWRSLIFGLLETMVIVAYQLGVGISAADDSMVDSKVVKSG